MRIRKNLHLFEKNEGQKGYTYVGEHYSPFFSGKALTALKWKLALAVIFSAVLVFLIGFLDFGSLRHLAGILPYLVLLFFCGRGLLGLFSLLLHREQLFQLRQHAQSWLRMKSSAMLCIIAAFAQLLALLVLLLLGQAGLTSELPQLALLGLVVLVNIYLFQTLTKHPCSLLPGLKEGRGKLEIDQEKPGETRLARTFPKGPELPL